MKLKYNDTGTFYEVTAGAYRNDETVVSYSDVPIILLQNTGTIRGNFQLNTNSDAVAYADPTDDFIVDNYNRLEGMYLLASLYGAPDADSWYKVTKVTVNRDHLLNNQIDNVQLDLKKTSPLPNVS